MEEQGTEKKEEGKVVIRKKRRKKKHRRSFLSMLKRGVIWGISIGIALLSILFAILTLKW
ncbi:hypothetical protein H5T88_03105 [bacterium]|nr:hypothetical protein [bacterium]